MRRSLKVAAASLAVLALALFGAPAITAQAEPAASSVVMVKDGGGHGSGVHIGNGYILTAAHVVGIKKEMDLKLSDGSAAKADVLWVNSDYDIALMRASVPLSKSSHLQCREPYVGEEVSAIGNPMEFEFVSAFGRISGGSRGFGHWKSVVITDMTTVMGASGGPMFDSRGNVVGIVVGVGVMPLPAGFTIVPALTGYGVAVPGDEICNLLAVGAGWA